MELYHPRRKRNEIISEAEKLALLKAGNHVTVALCDNNIPYYESLVIRGTMVIVDELAEKKHGLQVILNHLEKDPQPIFDRNIKDDHSYDSVTIIKMNIESIIGKRYMG